jgi:hypothetical protein
MDDKNDKLHEFIDAVDVWREVGPTGGDVWRVTTSKGDVERRSDVRKFDRTNGSKQESDIPNTRTN